ncbi:MAG: CsgG/HfaB family protein [Bacteroidota bacterium]|nr:CsgG/HfaB family protein [Bacteroidota bacterium]
MIFKRLIPFAILLGLLSSCTTVKPPEKRNVPENKIEQSKSITNEEHSLKRKVAIARFTNETKYGQGFFYDKNEDRLGKQAMDIFSAKLTSTNKFVLIERADLEFLNKEKEMSKISEAGISADYLILGSVTEFGRKSTSDVGVFSRTKKQTAYAKVNVRLVEVKTGLIIYSEEGSGEAFSEAGTVLGVGETADYDATLNDKVISAAISKLVSNITENLSNKPWRSYMLSFTDGNYIIAGGKLQGIKEGNEFSVYKRGAKVNNPQTGTAIELPGKSVGKLKVVSIVQGDVTTELSICSGVGGDLPKDNFGDYYIEEK